MRLGILETGTVNENLVPLYGEYPEMFTSLYKSVDPSVQMETFAVLNDVFPQSPRECDAWLITGSKFGVYDDEIWIAPLKQFLRSARTAGVPMIGICFGHQIMAEAFGGRVEKSAKGWGCGVHEYAVGTRPDWFGHEAAKFAMHAMHQDQVTAIPQDATCHASSDFCEFALISYGDPQVPEAISIQPHPEFAADYARDLVKLRAGSLIPEEVSGPALETFGETVHNRDFVEWSLEYLKRALAHDRAA